MGLVTVALLTLAPLALRPVRLACLIHAANVHSEPGSNPSKKVEPPRSCRSKSPSDRSSIQGLRILTGRTEMGSRPSYPGPYPTPLPVDASVPTPSAPTRTPAVSTSTHHAGFPQGFITTSLDATSRSTELSKNTSHRRHRPERLPHAGCHTGRLDRLLLVILTSGKEYNNQ